MAQFAQAGIWRRWVVAIMCAAISFPFYAILVFHILRMVRDREPPSIEMTIVLAAVAVAAYLPSRWAYLLAFGQRNGRPLLSNAFLWGVALMFASVVPLCVIGPEPNYPAPCTPLRWQREQCCSHYPVVAMASMAPNKRMKLTHQTRIKFAYANLPPVWRAAYAWRYTAPETARFSTPAPDALRTFTPPTRMYSPIGFGGRWHARNA